MQYAMAALYDWSFVYPKGMFSNNGGDYDRNRMYGLGKQSGDQYKKLSGVDMATGDTWLVDDWKIRSIVSPYRDKTISFMMKDEKRIVATPIDSLAESERKDYYADIKSKLLVKKLLDDVNKDLSSHPLITTMSGEPVDLEELEMRMELGEQFVRSKDAELAIELGMYENNYKILLKGIYEDLFDLGVAGYKEWLGNDNKPKVRKADPSRIVMNYCRNSDFSDMVHCGELIEVPLTELATLTNEDGSRMFTEEQLQMFASSITNKFGNPGNIGYGTQWMKPYDKFKCQVFDIEFYTYNDYSYEVSENKNKNRDFRKAKYGRGKESDKYMRKRYEYVYKCKWIVGTEYCYGS